MCLTPLDENGQVYVLLTSVLLAFLPGPALICLWWRYTSRSAFALAAGYFALASISALLSGAGYWGMLWTVVGYGAALPWVAFLVSSDCGADGAGAQWLLIMAGVNAGAVQLLARRAIRLESRYQRWLRSNNGINRHVVGNSVSP